MNKEKNFAKSAEEKAFKSTRKQSVPSTRGGLLHTSPAPESKQPSVSRLSQEDAASNEVQPPLVNFTEKDKGNLKEDGGNARPTPLRKSLSGKSPLSHDKHSSSSRDSSSDRSSHLLRSNSFTKDGPSGVVPVDEIPDVSRLIRSSSFTKLHPGLPEDMIPRITSESSEFSLDVNDSIDTSLLMKDTDEVRRCFDVLRHNDVKQTHMGS